MSETQVDRPVSRKTQVIGVTAVVAVLAGVGVGIGVAAHNAQIHADALHAMTVAAPAYEGAISLGGNLDQLSVQSVQAKAAYDAEQARIAQEQAAQAAALAAQQQAAQQAAAEQAAQQQAAQQQAQDAPEDPAPTNTVPFISDPNSSDGGRFDTSQCGSAGATTNPDGSVTCAG
jgi:regulator of protease activity HflC (stomatin/prohibitin superfamily)